MRLLLDAGADPNFVDLVSERYLKSRLGHNNSVEPYCTYAYPGAYT